MIDGDIGDGMEHVQVLAGEIGKRNTGSEGERRAAAYICEQKRFVQKMTRSYDLVKY